jgi:hypothetical protein
MQFGPQFDNELLDGVLDPVVFASGTSVVRSYSLVINTHLTVGPFVEPAYCCCVAVAADNVMPLRLFFPLKIVFVLP